MVLLITIYNRLLSYWLPCPLNRNTTATGTNVPAAGIYSSCKNSIQKFKFFYFKIICVEILQKPTSIIPIIPLIISLQNLCKTKKYATLSNKKKKIFQIGPEMTEIRGNKLKNTDEFLQSRKPPSEKSDEGREKTCH